MYFAIFPGKVIYGFAHDPSSSNYFIAVHWKERAVDTKSYSSMFSTTDYLWDNMTICQYDIETTIGKRGIHLNGKLYWIECRPDEEVDLVHFIMCYRTDMKEASFYDIDVIEEGSPEYLAVVHNKLGVIFRCVVNNIRVLYNVWVCTTDNFPHIELEHKMTVDGITQHFDLLGYDGNSLVFYNGYCRNGGNERDIVFSHGNKHFTRTIHGTFPIFYDVKQLVSFQFQYTAF